MKWTNSSSSSTISNSNGASINGGSSATNGTVTNTADRRQSIFYTTEATIPINSPPIVILDQKFNGVSSKNAGINEIKTKDAVSENYTYMIDFTLNDKS